MKRLNKAIICIFLGIISSSASAGKYTQTGYITSLKANVQGKVCDIMISATPTQAGFQGGQWSCDSIISQNMFNVAELAKTMGYKVHVIMEGNGADYKPVYSIEIIL